jgi:hypothetical protein
MYENILSNMLGCQTYCISDSPSNRYCFIGPIECNEKLIEVFKKGITVKLKYVEKRVLDTFTDNGIDLSNYTHCIIVKRNFYLAWQRQNINNMNNFVIDTPDNFWQIRWLDKYMEGHKGFIAGGCFKNILSGERVKDIDIFFESESDFQEAIDSFNDEKHQKEGWKFKYRNEKVCAFQKEGEKVWIEFIESEFGKPKEILRSFDFTVTKMAYYKEPKYEEKEDDYFPFSSASIVAYEYKLLYHEKFFEHLHMKRLVIDENIPFPVSTWERSYRYKGYGYNMCRETKKKLLQAIKGVNVEEEDVSLYTTGGWD